MTADETAVGFVNNITFDIETGQVEAVEASNGATAKLLLGTLEVPASYIAGFKRGMGADLAVKEDSREAGEEVVFKGARFWSPTMCGSSLPKVVGPRPRANSRRRLELARKRRLPRRKKPLSLQSLKSRPQRLPRVLP